MATGHSLPVQNFDLELSLDIDLQMAVVRPSQPYRVRDLAGKVSRWVPRFESNEH